MHPGANVEADEGSASRVFGNKEKMMSEIIPASASSRAKIAH